MSSNQQLYQQLERRLRQAHPTLHLKRLTVWVWMVVGLIQGQSVQLSEIANHILGDAKVAGRVTRLRRFLTSRWIVSRELYFPILSEVLKPWKARDVTIILDGCFIRLKKLQMLRVSLSHCYRALPLDWEVVTSKGNVELTSCERMLSPVASLLRHTRRVTFLADRGFRSRDWARKSRELGWDYIIRLANNTTITFPGGVERAADQLGIKKGERRYLRSVRITEEADWLCNLAITWTRETPSYPAELCVVMTNLEPSGWVLRHYLRRMRGERGFREDKSGGFDLHALLQAPDCLAWPNQARSTGSCSSWRCPNESEMTVASE